MSLTKEYDANAVHKITGIVRQLHPKSGPNWSRALCELDTGGTAWCVGKFGLEVGEVFVATAKFNAKYKSYDLIELVTPDTNTVSNGVVVLKLCEYLTGVGKVKAAKLSEKFPDALFEYVTTKPAEVAAACGAKLADVVAVGEQLKVEQTALGKLTNLIAKGFPNHIAKRICRSEEIYQVAIKSPYKAVPLVDGLGWLTADEIGRKQGIPKDNVDRIDAGIDYVYDRDVTGEGHTRATYDYLCETGRLPTVLGLHPDDFRDRLTTVLVPVADGCLTADYQRRAAQTIHDFFLERY